MYLFIGSLEKNNLSVYNVLIDGSILLIVNITMIIIDERIYNSIIISNEKNILKQQSLLNMVIVWDLTIYQRV